MFQQNNNFHHLSNLLKNKGLENIQILDGDIIRENLSLDLGFSKKDRIVNMKRVGFISSLLARNNVITIAALTSPHKKTREEIKIDISNFIEVYINCPLAECEL